MRERRNINRIDHVEYVKGNFFSGSDVGVQFVKQFEKVLGSKVNVDSINDPSTLFVNKVSDLDAELMIRLLA